MIKKFKIFEEVEMVGSDMTKGMPSNINDIFSQKDEKYEEFKKQMIEVAKKGKLYNQIASGKRLTFGVLKAFHHDALKFKEHREYIRAIYKFLHRMIPLALAPVYFPVWIISQGLGFTRAINKVLSPMMKIKSTKSILQQQKQQDEKGGYVKWMQSVIMKTLDIAEGELENFSEDWFYKSFAVERGLLRMVDHQVIIKFAYKLALIMEKKPDYEPVPPYYVENELRKYLNKEFDLDPKLPLKKDNRQTIRSLSNQTLPSSSST